MCHSLEGLRGVLCSTCQFSLFTEPLLIDASQAAKKVEPCRVQWPVSSPSRSQSAWWYNCTTMEIQSRDGPRWGATALPSLPCWLAYRLINIKNFKLVWIKGTSVLEGDLERRLSTSFSPNVSMIVVLFMLCECSEADNGVRTFNAKGVIIITCSQSFIQ